MDKELLAHRLYIERVSELMGDCPINEQLLEQMWENKATPAEAAKALQEGIDSPHTAGWLQRYLNR